MTELLKTTVLVKEILTDIPDTRNSDSYLYLKVLERVAKISGEKVDLRSMSVPYFLCNIKKLNFPQFETVRRTRQKMQADFPELKGKAEIEAARSEREKVFREYARGGNNGFNEIPR